MTTTDLNPPESEAKTSVNVAFIVERIGSIADSLVRKITWFVVTGILATLYLAWTLYSAESALWWNALKCGLVALPALLWAFVWMVLAQLREAPSQMADLINADNQLVTSLRSVSLGESRGLGGLFRTLNAIRKEDGLSAIFDTIGGVTLLANPLFALFALTMMVLLVFFIVVALTMLVF